MLGRAIPILRARSSAVAEAFYCGKLGFRVLFAGRATDATPDPCYLGLERDGAQIHVSSFPGDGEFGSAVYVYAADLDALFGELLAKGVPISLSPTEQTWGNREMYVDDPDGNTIRFVQDR